MGSIPSTTAIVGSMKGRCPNMAAEVGRESAFGNSAFDRKKYSKGRLQRMNEVGLPEVDEEQPLTMKVPEGDENEEKEGDEEEEEGDESSNTSIQKGTSQQAKRKVTDTKATSKQRESTPKAKKRGGGVDERTPLRESSVGTTTSGGSSGGNQKKGGKKKGTPPKDTFQDEENEACILGSPIGWKLNNTYPHVMPTAPFATPPSMSFSDAPTVAMGGRKSISSSGIPTPKSPAPVASTTLEMGSIPSTTAIVGSMKGRCPNMAAEVGRESAFGNSAFDRKKYSKGRLQRMNEVGLPEVDEEQPLTMKVPEGDENEEKEGDEEEEEGDESSNTSIQKGTSQQAKRKVTDTKSNIKAKGKYPTG
uniref:Uncharacterized protein n=1 Tax=Meloidogyne incognita TaxID=6306 RepID=A0A914N6M2_MELIC